MEDGRRRTGEVCNFLAFLIFYFVISTLIDLSEEEEDSELRQQRRHLLRFLRRSLE